MKQFKANYKTLIPAIVASGVVLYEALSGHQVSAHNQAAITNDSIAIAGFIITVAGIIYNHFHKKDVSK